jgi:hypothetical protein
MIKSCGLTLSSPALQMLLKIIFERDPLATNFRLVNMYHDGKPILMLIV